MGAAHTVPGRDALLTPLGGDVGQSGGISKAGGSLHSRPIDGAGVGRDMSGGGSKISELPHPDTSGASSSPEDSASGDLKSAGRLPRAVPSRRKADGNLDGEAVQSDLEIVSGPDVEIEDDDQDLLAEEDEDVVQVLDSDILDSEKEVPGNPSSRTDAIQSQVPTRKRQWSDDLFDESFLSTIPYAKPTSTEVEMRFIEDCLELRKDSRVLDLGCGFGRHAIGLAERGYSITGLDSSAEMIKRANEEASAMHINVELIHFDMRDLSFDRAFDCAYCVNTSFGFYDDETNQNIIDRICRSLVPGGKFLLEVVNRDYVIDLLPARLFWPSLECVVSEEADFDYITCRLNSDRALVFDDGKQVRKKISMRLYSAHELAKMFYRSGFDILEISGHYAHRSRFFGSHSRSLIMLAQRA